MTVITPSCFPAEYEYIQCKNCGLLCEGPDVLFCIPAVDAKNIILSIPFPDPWRGCYSSTGGLKIAGLNNKTYSVQHQGQFLIKFYDNKTPPEVIPVDHACQATQSHSPKAKQVSYLYSRSKECGMFCKGPGVEEVIKPDDSDSRKFFSFSDFWKGKLSTKHGLRISNVDARVYTISQKNVDFKITFTKDQEIQIEKTGHTWCLNENCPRAALLKETPHLSLKRSHTDDSKTDCETKG